MKKLILLFAILLLTALSSCRSHYKCPTYMKISGPNDMCN